MMDQNLQLFHITGADRDTGHDARMIIETTDTESAIREANAKGILVSTCSALVGTTQKRGLYELGDPEAPSPGQVEFSDIYADLEERLAQSKLDSERLQAECALLSDEFRQEMAKLREARQNRAEALETLARRKTANDNPETRMYSWSNPAALFVGVGMVCLMIILIPLRMLVDPEFWEHKKD